MTYSHLVLNSESPRTIKDLPIKEIAPCAVKLLMLLFRWLKMFSVNKICPYAHETSAMFQQP